MAVSTIELLRQEVTEYINHSDERMLRAVHALLEADNATDWYDDISEEHKAAIDEGIRDMEAGNTIPHKEMVKMYRKWLN